MHVAVVEVPASLCRLAGHASPQSFYGIQETIMDLTKLSISKLRNYPRLFSGNFNFKECCRASLHSVTWAVVTGCREGSICCRISQNSRETGRDALNNRQSRILQNSDVIDRHSTHTETILQASSTPKFS